MPDLSLAQKSLLATIILGLAVLQLLSMSLARGWVGSPAVGTRRTLSSVHRLGGYIGLVLILLVAYYCVFVLEASTDSARASAHAFLGAASVGLVWAKVAVRRVFTGQYRRLPLLGILLVGVIAGTWSTSALWYYTNL